jgi:hypothetical protein
MGSLIEKIAMFFFGWFTKTWRTLSKKEKKTYRFFIFNSVIISLLFSFLIIFCVGYWVFDLRLGKNRLNFGSHYPYYLNDDIMRINPVLGWQNSHVEVKNGEKIEFKVTGMVNVGINHIVNKMNVSKSLVAHYSNDPFLNSFDTIYPFNFEKIKDKGPFRREWENYQGQTLNDDMLDSIKLVQSANWGALLCIIIDDENVLEIQDPSYYVGGKDSTPVVIYNIVNYAENREMICNKDGHLYFIVNDACASEKMDKINKTHLGSKIKRAIIKAADSLNSVSKCYYIDKERIPLFWYSDNVGEFKVKIIRK